MKTSVLPSIAVKALTATLRTARTPRLRKACNPCFCQDLLTSGVLRLTIVVSNRRNDAARAAGLLQHCCLKQLHMVDLLLLHGHESGARSLVITYTGFRPATFARSVAAQEHACPDYACCCSAWRCCLLYIVLACRKHQPALQQH